ncbi:15551_t:CDS:2 [Gigaspora margarita]|uniref:15551_t:CDS:1 n=1 Tax=Gigaspora margarita TaxID=4874 RepID=A0ABN7VAS9_GIGMA|nr:15551_t:CDS:2 [Gigaspora margarita]
MGRYSQNRRSNFTNFTYYNQRMQNITPLPENLDSSTSANAQNNDDNNCGLWWDKLENLSNSNKIKAYSPRWNRSCTNSPIQFTFSFTTGSVVNLQYPHAFTVNGRAYHQIHSANTEGYPINWFVYDADARNNIVSQRGLDQDIVNRIKQELEAINPFIQGLYQLRDVNYPQARLIIKQPTANTEIAACTIVHSTAIMQE